MKFSFFLLPKRKATNQVCIILTLFFVVLFIYIFWIDLSNKCEMEKNLTDLLQVTNEILSKHNIIFFLISGPLLGYVRSNRLPSQDYDIDVVMNPDDYDKIMSLKSEFKYVGYSVYGKNDILPYTLITDRLEKVSIRIYNDKTHYFLELFDNYFVPPNEIQNLLSKYHDVNVPKNYNVSESFICLGRRHTAIATEQCHYYKDIYPLKKVTAFPEKFDLYIPNNPHNILLQLYGKDYMIPQAKGYKAVVCKIRPKNTLIVVTFIYISSLFLIILFKM